VRERRWYTWLELVSMAENMGYELTIDHRQMSRMMRLTNKADPDCWGTVSDLSTGEPAKGVRHYSREGWNRALPDNIQHIEHAHYGKGRRA